LETSLHSSIIFFDNERFPWGSPLQGYKLFLLSTDHRKNGFIDIVRFHVLIYIRDGLRRLTVTRDGIKIAVEKRCYRVRILQKRSRAVQENLSMADAYDHMVNGNHGDAGMNMDFDGDEIQCTCGIVD
jgi:hypothetical protein